jgi:7,8-dihydro-6-hydroxymethylpterin-pyrophosphokinase
MPNKTDDRHNRWRERELDLYNRSGVFIGLGSNLGNREANLREARNRLELLGIEIVRASSNYETEPWGYANQPKFLNQVIQVEIKSDLTERPNELQQHADSIGAMLARKLLSNLLKVEIEMGRQRTIANGPRIIDLDLLLFGDLILNSSTGQPDLEGPPIVVPHPRMHVRRFVLEPLCEIAPENIHPVLQKTCLELLSSVREANE